MNNSLPSDTTSESPHHTTINITENPIVDATDGDDATTISARSIGTTSASPSGSPLHTATTAAPVARARRKSRTSLTDNHSNVDVHRGTSPDRLLRRSRRASFDMDSLHLQPLRETDIENKEPIPPLAGPEIWDTDKSDGSDSAPALPQPGVDDGFFTRTNGEEDEPGIDDGFLLPKPKDKDEHDGRAFSDDDKHHYDPDHHHHNGVGSRRGSFPPFPYAPDFTPMTPDGDPRVIPDVNVYQHKKTLAQGMMDLALLSANANQLRYVLESYDRHPYYFPSLILISMSLVLQIAVGVGLIWNSRYNVKDEDDICRADKINNYTVIGIFLITIVNVFVSSFGVANPPGQTATT